MSKASRLRQAKERRRARERAERRSQQNHQHEHASDPRSHSTGSAHRSARADWSYSRERLADLTEQLAAEAVHADFHDDVSEFSMRVTRLAELSRSPGSREVVDQTLFACLQGAVVDAWRRGWQPTEIARHVRRILGDVGSGLTADMIAADSSRYAAATVDDRWLAQLTALEAHVWWGSDGYLDCWRDREGLDREAAIHCVLRVLSVLTAVPDLARLCPLPGTARKGSLASSVHGLQPADERLLERVRALLAKAESTEFSAEAEALTARAQEMMARHSIDHAMLAHGSGSKVAPSARRLFVDNPYEAAKTVLLDKVALANRCRAIWHRKLGLCTVLGFPGDLDAVELLFTSLLIQATTAMVHAGARRDAYGRSRTRSFRQSFLTSYALRIGERFAEAARAAQGQAAAEHASVDLLPVLAARDRHVDEAVANMFPDLTTSAVASARDAEGWSHGRVAADLAMLHGRSEVVGVPT